MINTRVLERRLGWHSAGPDDEPVPPVRPISHAPVLQGRVQQAAPSARGPRRAAIEETWTTLAAVDEDPAELAARAQLVPGFARGSAPGTAFDQLRTQMMRALGDNGWRRVGITSPSRGAGRSFFAAGLAASIARLEDTHVLMVDGDLEAPGLAELFGVEAPGPIEAMLTGRRDPLDQTVRLGRNLAAVLNNAPVAIGAELIQSHDARAALKTLTDRLAPDVVIVDLPPLPNQAVAQSWLPHLDAVLLVSDGQASTARDIAECERLLEDQAPLLGVAMNKTEDPDPRPRARRRRR